MAKKQKTGRKRLPDDQKTVLVGFYTKKSYVIGLGGMAIVRSLCKQMVECNQE